MAILVARASQRYIYNLRGNGKNIYHIIRSFVFSVLAGSRPDYAHCGAVHVSIYCSSILLYNLYYFWLKNSYNTYVHQYWMVLLIMTRKKLNSIMLFAVYNQCVAYFHLLNFSLFSFSKKIRPILHSCWTYYYVIT